MRDIIYRVHQEVQIFYYSFSMKNTYANKKEIVNCINSMCNTCSMISVVLILMK